MTWAELVRGVDATLDLDDDGEVERATKEFQRRCELPETGVPDEVTREAMTALDVWCKSALRVPAPVGLGDRGDDVRLAQRRLNRAGVVCPVDGVFTAAMARRVRSFQHGARVPATGEVDAATWAVLL